MEILQAIRKEKKAQSGLVMQRSAGWTDEEQSSRHQDDVRNMLAYIR